MSPNISVIIPNFNHAGFLVQRIDSVLNQTYQDFEVIILDDCSTDNSKEIIESYRHHPKVKCIVYNEVNSGGTFKQWDKGINLAEGEYIWIAESDDYANELFLETLIEAYQTDTNIGLVYCQSKMVDAEGNVTKDLTWWTDDLSKERWNNPFFNIGVNEIQSYLKFKNTIPNASAALIKKKYLIEAMRPNIQLKLCGDWLVWTRILFQANIYYSNKPLNYFRFHANSVRNTTKTKQYFIEHLSILNEINGHVKNVVIYEVKLLLSLKNELIKTVNFNSKLNSYLKLTSLLILSLSINPVSINRLIKFMIIKKWR
jgi:glycosyltransferase involved in cell wall biosynthesis